MYLIRPNIKLYYFSIDRSIFCDQANFQTWTYFEEGQRKLLLDHFITIAKLAYGMTQERRAKYLTKLQLMLWCILDCWGLVNVVANHQTSMLQYLQLYEFESKRHVNFLSDQWKMKWNRSLEGRHWEMYPTMGEGFAVVNLKKQLFQLKKHIRRVTTHLSSEHQFDNQWNNLVNP